MSSNKNIEKKGLKPCFSCGDNYDVEKNGYCQDCWKEINFGEIPLIGPSERQLKSMECRVVRKPLGMS
jgi:hypothetical protein